MLNFCCPFELPKANYKVSDYIYDLFFFLNFPFQLVNNVISDTTLVI